MDKYVVYALINNVSIMSVGCAASLLWMNLVFPFRPNGRLHYHLFAAIKIAYVNMYWNIVLQYYYSDTLWFQIAFELICGASVIVGVAWVLFVGAGRMSDRFIYFATAEMYAMLIAGTSILVASGLAEPVILGSPTSRPGLFNLYYMGIGAVLIAISMAVCRPYLKRFSKTNLKYRKLGVALGTAYGISGIVSFSEYSLWSDRIIPYQILLAFSTFSILTIIIVVYQRNKKEQILKLNRSLYMQQNLMLDHCAEMEEQIRLITDMQAEMATHAEQLKRMLKELEYAELAGIFDDYIDTHRTEMANPNYSGNLLMDFVLHNKIKVCKLKDITAEVTWEKIASHENMQRNILHITQVLFDHVLQYGGPDQTGKRWIRITSGHTGHHPSLSASFSIANKKYLAAFKRDILMKRVIRHCGGRVLTRLGSDCFEMDIVFKDRERQAL